MQLLFHINISNICDSHGNLIFKFLRPSKTKLGKLFFQKYLKTLRFQKINCWYTYVLWVARNWQLKSVFRYFVTEGGTFCEIKVDRGPSTKNFLIDETNRK